jgi:hypothetical protein
MRLGGSRKVFPRSGGAIPYEELPKLAQVFLDDLANGGKGEIDLEAVEKLRRTGPDADHTPFDYAFGKYLSLHGQEEKAIHYWQLALTRLDLSAFDRSLAGYELIRRSYAPDCYLLLLDGKPKAEQPEKQQLSRSVQEKAKARSHQGYSYVPPFDTSFLP